MLKDERLEKIEAYVNQNRYASLQDLTRLFGASRATIRRDLETLESRRRLILTRGGASSVDKSSSYEPPYVEKKNAHHEEKVRIAEAARRRIKDGDTVMIDSGTTSYEMVNFMGDLRDVHVATNDLLTAVALTRFPEIDLNMIGGSVRKGFYTTDGYFAAANVNNYYFDRAFLCVDAINLSYGCMITNADEVDVKHSIIDSAKEVTVLCDHSKFEARAFISICPLSRVNSIITGRELDPEICQKFIDKGLSIEVV